MGEKKKVEFRVLRTNGNGHRFILEPRERARFRERCRHNSLGTVCDKGYEYLVKGACLIGCTPNVACPRMYAWDRRHGLEKPYTMVENEYPDMRPTTFTWHPATESPGKRRVVIAFRVKGHERSYMIFRTVRFLSPGVTPATCVFTEGDKKTLAVAWAYYDEIARGIAPWMARGAECAAWAWWPDGEETNKQKE